MTEKNEANSIIMRISVIKNVLKRTNVRKFLIYSGKMAEMFQ